jgi:hypothetical protein
MAGQFRCGIRMDGSGAGTASSSPNLHQMAPTLPLLDETEARTHERSAALMPPEHSWLEARRGALPAGHPLSWGLLTAGTVLDGTDYADAP